ncbi:MAG: asparaginase, partial [Jannaschia sp.]
MGADAELVQVVRGDLVESVHRGHAVICDGAGAVIEAWGDPATIMFPRSACKMIQALPLLETGAGRALSTRHLALSCASHRGLPMHTGLATDWLRDMGLGDADLRCGAHMPYSEEAQADLIRAGEGPCQVHNNCSGKHCGFLMVNRHLNGDPEYTDPD